MIKIKKILCLAFFSVLVFYVLILQYKEFNAELEQLHTLEKVHSRIFDRPFFDLQIKTMDESLTSVEDLDKKLNVYRKSFPAFDNAENFLTKLNRNSTKANVSLQVIKNTKFYKEFYNENLIVLTITGKEESLKKFSDFMESIKQLHSLKKSFLLADTADAFQLEISVFSLTEDDDDYYVIDKNIVNSAYLRSSVWVPYYSDISNGNVVRMNQILDDFKINQEQVDNYYSFLSKKFEFISKKNIIDELYRVRKPVAEAFGSGNK